MNNSAVTPSRVLSIPDVRRSRVQRGLALVALFLALGLSGLLLWVAQGLVLGSASYQGSTLIQPANPLVCPGDKLLYQVTITVESAGLLDVGRDWCLRNGTCNFDLHRGYNNVVGIPLIVETTGMVIPDSPWFQPGGEYEFRSGISSQGQEDIFIVPFTIQTVCP